MRPCGYDCKHMYSIRYTSQAVGVALASCSCLVAAGSSGRPPLPSWALSILVCFWPLSSAASSLGSRWGCPPGHQGESSGSHLCFTLCNRTGFQSPGSASTKDSKLGNVADRWNAAISRLSCTVVGHEKPCDQHLLDWRGPLRNFGAHEQVFLGLLSIVVRDRMQAGGGVVGEHSAAIIASLSIPEDLDTAECVLHTLRPHVHRPPTPRCATLTPAISSPLKINASQADRRECISARKGRDIRRDSTCMRPLALLSHCAQSCSHRPAPLQLGCHAWQRCQCGSAKYCSPHGIRDN